MTFREIAPPPPRVARPMCCNPASDDTVRLIDWRSRRYGAEASHCQRLARYEIDGKPYCSLHAGRIALQRWRDGALVEAEKT